MKKDDAKQKIAAGLEALSEAVQNGRSEEFEQYLTVMSRFHRYSFGNSILILCQRPDATHVGGYTRWQELGRQVKKGESGIGILAPMRYKAESEDGEEGSVIKGFKVVHVFDVSQTEGEELPEFAVAEGEPGENLARIEAAIGKEGIRLVEVEHLGGANGSSAGGEIQILSTLSRAERCRVLCHEWAHERLHHGARRHETTKTVRECEAEAVAFVICNALGIDALKRSSDYIQLYRGDTDTLSESLEFIQKTAAHLLDAIEIAELEKEGTVMETTEVDHGFCTVVQNVDINRIQLVFPGKPEEATRKLLKQNGFRWSRTESAWQRQLNANGRHAAAYVVKQLTPEEKGDTSNERSEQLHA